MPGPGAPGGTPTLTFGRAGRLRLLEAGQWLAAPLADVFAFFADAGNLEAITPPSLAFRILTPRPIAMHAGTLIDYRLGLFGLPLRWRTRIDRWEPGVAFVDRQLSGPYAHWVHLHTFASEHGGTRVGDRVEYALPLAPLSDPAHALFVRPMLERIFTHRQAVVAQRFG